jgi:hypothetical protein
MGSGVRSEKSSLRYIREKERGEEREGRREGKRGEGEKKKRRGEGGHGSDAGKNHEKIKRGKHY